MGGVVNTAPKDLRQLSNGFYGIACPHLGVEGMVQQMNKLQAHYGCNSNLGLKLTVSLDMLIVEVGVLAQPFRESLQKYSKRTTWIWVTSLWEKNVTHLT